MFKAKMKSNLLSAVGQFGKETAGNMSMIFAIGLTIMLGAVGVAIDLSGVVSEKSRLQDITDSAVLAASASGETDKKKLEEVVDDVMASHSKDYRDFTYKMTLIDENIQVEAKAKHETAIMGMFGYETINLSTKSGAPVPEELPVHISLVVDTTDSMAGDNLTSLQNAAGELIKIIKKSKDAGAKMAVVPFGNYVNVGMDNRNADWMDVPADFTETGDCYMYKPVKSKTGCTSTSKIGYNDGVPYDYESEEGCVYEYEDDEVEYCPAPRDVQWNGCAGSRNEPLNISAAANGRTEIPGAMGVSCGSEVLPLTDNFKGVEDAIDDLTTNGNTYLPAGILWGWRTLSPEAPYASASVSDKTVRAIVFMTDGGNTMTQYDRDGTGDDAYHRTISPTDTDGAKKASDRMAAVCDGAKSDGITVFTVAYKVPDGAAGGTADLENCASSSATAFSAENGKELEAAFKDIGKALATVRLTY